MKKRVDKFYKDFYVMEIYDSEGWPNGQDMSNILGLVAKHGCVNCMVQEGERYVVYHWA
jgi:hypothetical protein